MFKKLTTFLASLFRGLLTASLLILLISPLVIPLFAGSNIEDRLAYKLIESETQTLITVENILTEKGKEPIYCLSFADARLKATQIPQSIYEEYIGDDNNAITFKYTQIIFYISPTTNNFDETSTLAVERCALPWEAQDIAFTNENLEEFKTLVAKSGTSMGFTELSFPYDHYYRDTCTTNCLTEGATRWPDRQPNEPQSTTTLPEPQTT